MEMTQNNICKQIHARTKNTTIELTLKHEEWKIIYKKEKKTRYTTHKTNTSFADTYIDIDTDVWYDNSNRYRILVGRNAFVRGSAFCRIAFSVLDRCIVLFWLFFTIIL